MSTLVKSPIAVFGQLAEKYETLTVADAAEFMTAECRIHEAAGIPEIGRDWVGPEGFVGLMAAVQAAFRGFKFHLVNLVEQGDKVLVIRGQLTADLPAGSFSIPIVEYWEFSDGKATDILPIWHDTKLVSDLYYASYPNGRVPQG